MTHPEPNGTAPTPGDREPCDHCWHDTWMILTSLPPQKEDVCCKCGERKSYRVLSTGGTAAPTSLPHGPFLPRFHLW